MTRILSAASILALGATGALAGGVDRSGQNIGVIFKEGSYAEFSFGSVSPDVSGDAVAALGGFGSGDMADRYFQFGAAIKHSYNDQLSVALIFDQPFGADVDYGDAETGYFADESTAELNSTAITGIVKYTMPSNISVYGGLRYQTLEAKAFIPFVTAVPGVTPPYEADGKSDGGLGYLVGVAYERPDIALRVALTYNSKIKHELDTTENSVLGAGAESVTEIETPQSVNLDFQTGIAPGTLLFGGIRWVEWSEFDITPEVYEGLTGGSLVSYDDDTITYSLGLGRKFTENWSAAVTVGYEKENGGFSSNLGPTDGNWSVGLGATYTMDNMEISGAIRYVKIGDAQTRITGFEPASNFEDNDAIGVGFRVGYNF